MKKSITGLTLRRGLRNITKAVYFEKFTADLEPSWVDIGCQIVEFQGKGRRKLLEDWNYTGYLIFDATKRHGLALSYLIESLFDEERNVKDDIFLWDRIFRYAAFQADDKYVATHYLKKIVENKHLLKRHHLDSKRTVIFEFLSLNSSNYISCQMRALISDLFSRQMLEPSEKLMTGEELMHYLDPSGDLEREISRFGPYVNKFPFSGG